MNDLQKRAVENLARELFLLMKVCMKDLWAKEDEEFLRRIASDVAREKVLAEMSPNPGEHIDNIEHLSATIEGEIVRRKLRIRAFCRREFVRLLTAVIRTVAIPFLRTSVGGY